MSVSDWLSIVRKLSKSLKNTSTNLGVKECKQVRKTGEEVDVIYGIHYMQTQLYKAFVSGISY